MAVARQAFVAAAILCLVTLCKVSPRRPPFLSLRSRPTMSTITKHASCN